MQAVVMAVSAGKMTMVDRDENILAGTKDAQKEIDIVDCCYNISALTYGLRDSFSACSSKTPVSSPYRLPQNYGLPTGVAQSCRPDPSSL